MSDATYHLACEALVDELIDAACHNECVSAEEQEPSLQQLRDQQGEGT